MTPKDTKCDSICQINTQFPENLNTYQNVLEEQKKAYYNYNINKNSNYSQDRLKANNSLSLVNSIDNRLVNLNKILIGDLKTLTNQSQNNKYSISSNKTKIKELVNKVDTLQKNKKNYDNMIISAKQQKTNQLSNKKYVKLEYYSSKILLIILLVYFLFVTYSLIKLLIF
jgi:hypothetical protein